MKFANQNGEKVLGQGEMKKVKGLLKKSLREFQRAVAKFSQTLDFFGHFVSENCAKNACFFTKNIEKP